ncbi:AAA family ATPase [uncultured Thiodictyon sp.]|jgi:energy-coupling factor transporter ATP-binding protein EcfA2|uniref:AAA family ATPase n=1 Tax=uncultured Thiodictyon sp. TaxID=1846217 RepID=UPI0025F2A4E3|nr:AAA family ATPase [uncultured Thiodictyon sp.]
MEHSDHGLVRRLRLDKVRSFEAAEIDFAPRVTVLLGENGSGKTTVAEMLALLLVPPGQRLIAFPRRHGADRGRAEVFLAGRDQPAAVWDSAEDPSADQRPVPGRPVFAYGRFRQFFTVDQGERRRINNPGEDLGDLAHSSRRDSILTLFRPDPGLLQDLSRALVALHYGAQTLADARLTAVWTRLNQSLKALECGFDRIEIEEGEYEYIPRLVRKKARLALSELSDGYQSVLTILFDLVLRYAFRFITLPDPLLAAAIVVIDEIDLHLHPRWQRTVLNQFTKVFPNTQFIVTTHSPAVVQGAVDAGHRIISLTESGGISKAKPLSPSTMRDLKGAEIGALLLDRRLFGVGSRYSSEYSAIEDRIDDLEQRIESGTATEADEKQLFKDLETLQGLMVKDEGRRAEGGVMAQMADLRRAFLQDLAELKREQEKGA